MRTTPIFDQLLEHWAVAEPEPPHEAGHHRDGGRTVLSLLRPAAGASERAEPASGTARILTFRPAEGQL